MSNVYSKELVELVEDSSIKNKSSKCRANTILGEKLLNETDFLIGEHTISDRLLYIKHDIHEHVKCISCGNFSKIDKRSVTFRIKFCSVKCNFSYVDENGLSNSQKNAINGAKTMSILDIDGNSIRKHTTNKGVKTRAKIDPETGLSINDEIGIKSSKTKNIIDEKTGLSISKLSGLNGAKTRAKINLETGLSINNENAINGAKTMSILDIDGNSIRKNANIKRLKTRAKIDLETGLSINDEFSINKLHKTYDYTLNKFSKHYNEYELLTTLHDHINSNDRRLIKYRHKCGSIIESLNPSIRCITCYPYNKSIGEHEVLEYCQSLTESAESNTRNIISPLELDVYLPDYNLAIEYNGIYWHSSNSIETENRDYHLNKTLQCKEKGIQLLHIFENEWINPIKQSIWKSIIRNKLGQSERIYGRKTEIRIVDNITKIEFLEMNHLQGNCSSSINIGLYYENELVSLMTFGKSRYDKKIDWELLRFCNRLGSSVLGAASKLLKHFMIGYKGSIISYADRRRSDGGLYQKLGFELSHISKPNYWYWDNKSMNLESRIKYQKHKLKDKLEEFDLNLTESENMYMNGYRKIFDCGNYVYKL